MTAPAETIDPRTAEQKREMDQFFSANRVDYEQNEAYLIVYEDDDVAVVADHNCNALIPWADQFEIDSSDMVAAFRAEAGEVMGDSEAHEAFSYSDPIVFEKI